jgi:hypothetical protein
MAEIPIERKPRRSTGPLLIVLILILLLAAGWYWWTNYRTDDTPAPATTNTTQSVHPASMAEFSVFSPSFRRS